MSENRPKVGVGVFIFKDGKFLMGKRIGSHGKDSWSVPGGYLEFGESFEDCSKREVLEETCVKVKNVRFGAVTNNYFAEENKHTITIWMLGDYESGEPQIMEPDKFVEIDWFDFDNLPQPLFLPWKQLLESEFIGEIKLQVHS